MVMIIVFVGLFCLYLLNCDGTWYDKHPKFIEVAYNISLLLYTDTIIMSPHP